jgi:hypothetical protein
MHTLLLGLVLAIGMGDKVPPAPTVTVVPTTFSTAYFEEVDKANTLFDKYMKTSCQDADYLTVDEAMKNEYYTLKGMAKTIETNEQDPIKQDHEFETFVGFQTLLADSVKSHRQCEENAKKSPNT